MPVAMACGGVFHNTVARIDFLTPYLIFAMLFIPFCGVKVRELRLSGLHTSLLLFQAVMSVAVYIATVQFDREVAQGAMICFMAPTATAAVVIASMLGARVSTMITYSLAVNVAVAVGAPLVFSMVAPKADVPFWESFVVIFLRVIPVIVLPFATGLVLRWFLPRVADFVTGLKPASFYLWLVALAVVSGKTVNFIASQQGLTLGKGLWLAGAALVICLLQFFAGKFIGRKYGETIAGGQALGQKNTILAIWLAQTYLNPVSSIAPAAYVLWQNLFNSIQLWRRNRSAK